MPNKYDKILGEYRESDQGVADNGIPVGGVDNEFLVKTSGADFDAEWRGILDSDLPSSIARDSEIITDHTLLSNIGVNTHAQIDTHVANTSNPHNVTATQLGLVSGGSGDIWVEKAGDTMTGDLDIETATGALLTLGRVDTSVTANDVIGKIQFYAADTSTTTNFIVASIEAQAVSTVATDINPGRIIFKTTGTAVGDVPTEAMRIEANNNVGIGLASASLTAASFPLDLVSGIASAFVLRSGGGAYTSIEMSVNVSNPRIDFKLAGTFIAAFSADATNLLFRNNGTGGLAFSTTVGGLLKRRISVLNNGYTALGTTTPTELFQVVEPVDGVGTVTTNGTVTLTGSNTDFLSSFNIGDTITVSGETVRTITAIASDTSLTVSVAFSTSAAGLTYVLVGGTRISVLGNGKVGIGTTTPVGRLDLTGSVTGAPSATIGKLFTISTSIITDNTTAGSGTATAVVFHSISTPQLAASNTLVTTSDAFTLWINGGPVASTNQTITRSYALGTGGDIFSGGDVRLAAGKKFLYHNTGTANALYRDSGTGDSVMTSPAALRFGSDTLATTYMSILSSGKVGIGQSTPTALLHIKAGTATANTAPLQFTSGVIETVARAGVMEYDDKLQFTESDAVRRFIVQAVNNTKITAGAPYTNDGYVTMRINGTDYKFMTTT